MRGEVKKNRGRVFRKKGEGRVVDEIIWKWVRKKQIREANRGEVGGAKNLRL